jgi:hypothetical protein
MREFSDPDFIVGQTSFVGTGTGVVQACFIPLPSILRSFIIEMLSVLLTDNNVNGSIAAILHETAGNPLLFVTPVSAPTNPAALASFPPPAFNQPSMGPAAQLVKQYTNSGAGTSLAHYTLESPRNRIYVPTGYQGRVYVKEPADATPHTIAVTLLAQIRWLCACG